MAAPFSQRENASKHGLYLDFCTAFESHYTVTTQIRLSTRPYGLNGHETRPLATGTGWDCLRWDDRHGMERHRFWRIDKCRASEQVTNGVGYVMDVRRLKDGWQHKNR